MLLGLQINCELENLTDLRPSDEEFRWYLKVKCTKCGECTSDFVYFCELEKVALQGSKGSANLVWRCKFCNRTSNADIVKDSINLYTDDDSGQFKTIVVFDCRGLEFIEFSPRAGWSAVGLHTGTLFPDISLTEKEWCDYDEKGKCTVSILNMESRFIKIKH